jgi:hypothetical protein
MLLESQSVDFIQTSIENFPFLFPRNFQSIFDFICRKGNNIRILASSMLLLDPSSIPSKIKFQSFLVFKPFAKFQLKTPAKN